MRLDPASYPFDAANVVNGVARPERWTNLWVSDPAAALPQWIAAKWDGTREFDAVYLTFDTFLHYDPTFLPPFWRAKKCVKDYRLEVNLRGRWKTISEVSGLSHRRFCQEDRSREPKFIKDLERSLCSIDYFGLLFPDFSVHGLIGLLNATPQSGR